MTALMKIENVAKHFPARSALGGATRTVRAVDGVSLEIRPGETVGLVGESGSGKSTIARLALKLLEPTSGDIQFKNASLIGAKGPALRQFRAQVQAVFQDPYASLNPRIRVGATVAEPLVVSALRPGRAVIEERTAAALAAVELPPDAAKRYPHQFSGGQRQRIAIARALILQPELVVLDEPISALDVSVRAQILNLLADLQKQHGMAYLFIAHDLPAVAAISDTIAVMYCGKLVEVGPAGAIASAPMHPYTQMLFASVLTPERSDAWEAADLTGEPASPINPPSGCRFHPRCPQAVPQCRQELPIVRTVQGRQIRCHLVNA